jgi:tetratricopeptide (TPR) repeat protein
MKTRKRDSARVAPPQAAHKPPAAHHGIWYGTGLAALAVLFWVYGPDMHTGFLFDDVKQQFALPTASQPLPTWIGRVRPVLMFSYWANTRISMEDTFSFHLFNILIHALAGIFIFLVIRRLLEWAGAEKSTRTPFAAFGALLFLLHPLQSESVAYISGRSDALCGLFGCAAFAVLLYRPSPAIAWARVLPVVLLFATAVLSKEQAVVLPALFVLTDIWWNPDSPWRAVLANWKLYVVLALGAAAGVALFWWMITGQGTHGSAGFGMKDFSWYQYLFTQFRAIFAYLFNFLLPIHLTADWDFPISHGILEHGSILGLAALLALAAVAWRYRRRFPLAGYGYFVFLVLLSPTSSILPIQDPIADRRMYFPILGLILIAIDLLRRLKVEPKVLATGAAALLLAAALATHARAQVWSDPILLWQDTARKSPNKVRAHFQLAFAYFEQGRNDLAVAEFQKTAELQPPSADLLLDWGLAYDALHQPVLALAKLRQSAALDSTPQVYTQIAKVYAEQQQWAEALDALSVAEKLDPNFAITYVFRGKVFLNSNRPAEAVAQYQRALAIDPQVPDGRHDLAIAQSMLRPGR